MTGCRRNVRHGGGEPNTRDHLSPAGRVSEAGAGSTPSHIPGFSLLPRTNAGLEVWGPHWGFRLMPKSLSQTLAQIPFEATVISPKLLPASWITERGIPSELSAVSHLLEEQAFRPAALGLKTCSDHPNGHVTWSGLGISGPQCPHL